MAKSMKNEIKKPRGKAAAVVDDDDALDGGALPSGDDIKAHIKSLSGLKAKVSELSGQIGAEAKRAKNELNIHNGAAGLALKFYRMDEEKRDEFLRHFDSYRLQLGFGRQDDLFNDPTPAETATFAGRDA